MPGPSHAFTRIYALIIFLIVAIYNIKQINHSNALQNILSCMLTTVQCYTLMWRKNNEGKCEKTSPEVLQSLVVTFEPVPQLSSDASMSVSSFASAGKHPCAHSCTHTDIIISSPCFVKKETPI